MNEVQEGTTFSPKKWSSTGLLVAVLGFIALFGGGISTVGWEVTMASYFFGFVFWLALTIGCIGLQKLHHTVRGSWGLSVLRLWEAGGSVMSFAVFAIAFLPIAFSLPTVYHHWIGPHAEELHGGKTVLLQPAFFIVRIFVYLAVWAAYAAYFRNSTLKQDETGDLKIGTVRNTRGAVSLVVFFLINTLFITDLVMSLDPHWFSTILGVWSAVSMGLGALSFAAFILLRYRNEEPWSRVITPKLTKDIGNMLFVLTMLWCYTTLSQYLIIWSGNMPEFNRFYLARDGWWNILGGVNIFLGFFVPWMLLLSPRVKANYSTLLRVTILIFVVRIIDWYWNIIPYFRQTPAWTDAAAWIAFAGLWFFAFGRTAAQAPLLVSHDRRLEEMKQMEVAHGH